MTNEETFKTLIELKLGKIGETIVHDAENDWQQIYSKRDFRPGELEQIAENYINNALHAELYFQSSKSLSH